VKAVRSFNRIAVERSARRRSTWSAADALKRGNPPALLEMRGAS
jgi:hypothetical protein